MDSVDFRVGDSTFFELIPFVSLGVGLCLLLTERVVDFLSELSYFLALNCLETELELSRREDALSLNDLISLDLRIIRLLTSSLDVRKASSGLSSLDSSAASVIDLTEGVYTFWTTYSYCLILDSSLAGEVRFVDGPFLTDSRVSLSRPVFPPPNTIPYNFFVVLLLRTLVFDWVFAIVAAVGCLSGTLLLFDACFAFNLLVFFFGEDDSVAFGKEFACPIFSVTVLKAFDFISGFKRL